jgi:FkbM family methyltransferase
MSQSSTNKILAPLEQLLAPGADHYRQSFAEACRKELGDPRRPLVLFGCGALGRYLANRLPKEARPVAFTDNNSDLWGKHVDGITVLSPQDAIAQHGATAYFVVTIYNGSAVRQQLRTLGCRHVGHVRTLCHAYPDPLLPHGGIADPRAIFVAPQALHAGLQVWADAESRDEYLAQLRWRLDPDAPVPGPHAPLESRYHEPALFRPLDAETFVDCGAFDGDSLQDFLDRSGGTNGQYIGFEPDPDNFSRLCSHAESLPATTRARVSLHNQAVGAESSRSTFSATATAGSRLSATGDLTVDCVTLDETLASIAPTVIKMDVEGHENDALLGGQKIIRQHQPLLVICLYHRPDDLWQLPLTIKTILPEYSLYLRRYAEDCWELVCYAVPPQRRCT